MFKKLLCMGSVLMGSVYGAEEVLPYHAQCARDYIKPDHEASLKLARAFSKINVNMNELCCKKVLVTPKTTVGDIKRYVGMKNQALYAQWYEPYKLENICSASLQDKDIIHEVISRHLHPPYINEVEFTFTLNPAQQQ